MKKTYITTMPNHIGAFLKASECFAKLGINITRVSYNKAIDSHTLFIDAEGTREQLLKADEELYKIGYLQNDKAETSVVLLECLLQDRPGSVTEILKLILQYQLNISYISSQESDSEYQSFKMGLFVDDKDKLNEFMKKAQEICSIKVLDYDQTERVFDNSIFYQSFVSGLMKITGLPEEKRDMLIVNSNLVMQILDESGHSPYRTFEKISRFTEFLYAYRGDEFLPRITKHHVCDNTDIIVIEPPCGSNTFIIRSNDEVLFIDSGYALYKDEMFKIFRELIPEFDTMKKRIYVTHADVDHCGLLPFFDEIITNSLSLKCFEMEHRCGDGYRELNPLHKPYVNILKEVTRYQTPELDKVKVLWETEDNQDELLIPIGKLDIGELHFEVHQGKGGHLPGEMVLVDYEHHVAFTGDIYVNVHGMTREQAKYNKYAQILMTSVDTKPELSPLVRTAVLEKLGEGDWKLFGSHGGMKE